MRFASLFAAACCLVLSGCASAPPVRAATAPFQRPDVIRFDASLEEIDAALTGRCEAKRIHHISERETQLDCGGFTFRGQGRHVEFVFRDDRLVIVWLMTTPMEAEAMIAAMTQAYGAPTARNSAYVLFAPDRAAWRFQPAEILFYAAQIDADVAYELTH